MKKGDIVKLKQGLELINAHVYGMQPQEKKQEFYTISESYYKAIGCAGEVELVVELDEINGWHKFEAKYFEVILPAGHPDVKKLMEESISSRVVV